MRYLLFPAAFFLSSCGLMETALGPEGPWSDPAVREQALAVAEDAIGGRWIGAMIGAGSLLGLIWGKQGVKALGKKLRDSEPGKIV